MEIILYDDVLPKLVCFLSPTLLKSYVFCFYSFPKTIRPHVCMYPLHSDEVVSLISGDESVVCSPMQWMLYSTGVVLPFRPLLLLCFVIKPLIYIDIYPRISLVSVLKNG